MRRLGSIARIAAVYLLLGFVSTWAVAWGLALLPPGRSNRFFISMERDYQRLLASSDYRAGVGSARHVKAARPRLTSDMTIGLDPELDEVGASALWPYVDWTMLSRLADSAGPHGWGTDKVHRSSRREFEQVIDDARGFPFLSAWCSWREATGLQRGRLVGGVAIPDHPSPNVTGADKLRALPYYPIWSGLALNTGFYALLFFAVVRTARAFRRSRRHARGWCPRCKYDREFDYRLPCPECGDAPPPPARAQGQRGAGWLRPGLAIVRP